MYRDNSQMVTHQEHRFILNHGALGDMITSLPAIVHARLAVHPIMKLTVYVAPWQVELVDHLLKPYGEISVRPITEVPLGAKDRIEEWGRDIPSSVNTAIQNTHTRNRVHMVDYAFAFLTDSRPDNMAQRSYPVMAPLGPRPSAFSLLSNYVVFPVGATSDNKLFKASVMTPVLRWVLERGYTPVIVGTKVSHTRAEMGDGDTVPLVIRQETDRVPADVFAQCLDLREKTTLLELRDVLGHALAVVGVDGGTLHLAGTTNVPIVYAMGTTLPKHRYIPRYGDHNFRIKYIVPRDLECAGCQSQWVLTRWDFRECPYGDSKCMDALHSDDFIEALKQLGL